MPKKPKPYDVKVPEGVEVVHVIWPNGDYDECTAPTEDEEGDTEEGEEEDEDESEEEEEETDE